VGESHLTSLSSILPPLTPFRFRATTQKAEGIGELAAMESAVQTAHARARATAAWGQVAFPRPPEAQRMWKAAENIWSNRRLLSGP
jgi:hypothetical protein